jgi:hypothetical protein
MSVGNRQRGEGILSSAFFLRSAPACFGRERTVRKGYGVEIPPGSHLEDLLSCHASSLAATDRDGETVLDSAVAEGIEFDHTGTTE